MRSIIYTIIFILSLLLFPGQRIKSQNNIASRYIFSVISINEGLPLNFVDDIYKDNHGFIWISTQGGGLSRYDGYEFVSFNVNSFPFSLKSNFIRQTCEDNFDRLWVVSNNGINIIDLPTMSESKISKQNDILAKVLDTAPNRIYKDLKGSIWLLTTGKIYKISFDGKGDIQRISTTPDSPGFSFTTINAVDGETWVSNGGSIFHITDNQTDNLRLQPIQEIPSLGINTFISTILKDRDNIWIGADNGLYKYNTKNQNIKLYTHNPKDETSISQNMVTELCMTNDGILVAGTLMGLNFYDPSSDSFEHISHCTDESTLNNDFVNSMLPDGNNLWIGTEAGGINKMTIRKLAIQNYTNDPNNSNSISPNPVNAIYEDWKGDLWVGTVEGGLNLKRKGENRFIHYTSGNGFLSHNSVSALEQDKDGHLWVGTWGGGITVLDINKLPNIHNKYTDVEFSYIGFLRYDSINHGMWIGTNRQIFFYDIQTNSIRNPLPENIARNILGTLGSMTDNDDKLWIGTSEGLIVVDLKSYNHSGAQYKAEYLKLDNQNITPLFTKNITCLYQAKDGSIWMGSNGYGMCRLIKYQDKYTAQSYTTAQGLANNTVFGLLEDEQGLIWASTGKGISSYNPQTERFVNYTKNDGLLNDQFYWNASYKSPRNGDLYFGSLAGLTLIKSNPQDKEQEQKKVTFTKLQILNETVWFNGKDYINKDIAYTNRIDLHERDKSFSIEFSALDYDNPTTVAYSYRLVGFDEKWIDVEANRRFISYTNLQPGTYTLQVRCMSKAYDWSNDIAELEIVVHPFFYKTSWFIGICILLIVILAVQFYRWRITSLKKQRETLHKKVEERTKELENQKKLLEEQAMELKLQNNILFTQNEKITSQRKQLMDMSKKVQEAMADRMSFFTNITHEFRTPITLIIGPIDRALKLSTNPKVIEQLQYVARNSKHLLSLVNQLMDFRKVESDRMKISLATGNILNLIKEILTPFESHANERNIRIIEKYRMAHLYIMFDEEAIRKLITNLLSNAIKFTPDNGSVTLYICSFTDRKTNNEKLYICVQDTGSGIKKEDLNRVFNKFYQSKGNDKYAIYGQSGTGIGLYLCKSIVEMLGGKIYAKNNPTTGASLRVILPIIRENVPETAALEEEANITYSIPGVSLQETSMEKGQKLVILVVEDNTDMRKYICSVLTDYYKVEEAENGQEALKILKSKTVDFIISDLMMPVMDGLELSQKVKADLSISHIPFLMLTAKTSLETQISSYKIGVDEFLPKPFEEELLLTRINNILESRKTYQRKFSLEMNVDELNISEESNDDKFLRKAVETVKANYKNTYYEVSDFIDEMGVSKSLLNKKMQTLTGQSAGNFIRNYRLNIAKELIIKSQGSMNISEVAYEVGFNDPKYFTRCFTKHFGVSPSMVNKSDNRD
ncbi:response regulator [Dysgonomonas sp. 521]|uniref:hybrid sensor histidine kinase/response regulator transcription factor n=1 Tax=Dysgonomonas sp. 521 TaxID=2302932 RepID=UPI0013D14BDA|nr:two-component regulator propeller domain-containing protein [Dysgonomonas sp. 521]NDV93755.1 response regulator [Dysgonomonas sp. 521]